MVLNANRKVMFHSNTMSVLNMGAADRLALAHGIHFPSFSLLPSF